MKKTEKERELESILRIFKQRDLYLKRGIKLPKLVLLSGPNGAGRGYMVRTLALEQGCKLFEPKQHGRDDNEIPKLFERAKRRKETGPAVIYITSFDESLLKDVYGELSSKIRKALSLMREDTLLIASCADPDDVVGLLNLPRHVYTVISYELPGAEARSEILRTAFSGLRGFKCSFDLGFVSKITADMGCSELEQVINDAAIIALEQQPDIPEPEITDQTVQQAVSRITLGTTSGAEVLTEEQERRIGTHEVGHLLPLIFDPSHSQDIIEVSIQPHSSLSSAGHCSSVPTERRAMKASMIKSELVSLMGARAAEMLLLGEYSIGSTADLNRASSLTEFLICSAGVYGLKYVCDPGSGSDKLRSEIEDLKGQILSDAEKKAADIISSHRELFSTLVDELVNKKVLGRNEIERLVSAYRAQKENVLAA